MSDAQPPTQIISLPEGGGAVGGIGETFVPDVQMGTGRCTVPIAVPDRRRGLRPSLDLVYSSAAGNGPFGLGWTLTVPGIARRTSGGLPRYDDARDTFILAGVEDLVPVGSPDPTTTRYRPRTEGPFLEITHHRNPAARVNHWTVAAPEGLVHRYGSLPAGGVGWTDPATLVDPDHPERVFAWKLTETRDPFGNRIVYEYDADEGSTAEHRWRQPLLRRIRYADHTGGAFLVSVTFDYAGRGDEFSDHRAGFEIRTTRRCRAITTVTHAGADRLVRRYELGYDADPYNGLSLLRRVEVVGFDDAGTEHRLLPPLDLGYTTLEVGNRSFRPVGGAEPPPGPGPGRELVDVTGNALPDLLELDGRARFWPNLGGGVFDRPRPMPAGPAGVSLADPGVRLLDADGDGSPDLLVTAGVWGPGRPGTSPRVGDGSGAAVGHFPLRFGGRWGRFRPYAAAPGVSVADPQVRLVDLDGDGVTDLLRSGTRLECWLHEADGAWSGPHLARAGSDGLPRLDLADPRLRLADMTGDGLADIVLVHDGGTVYWPNLGRGRWGRQVSMRDSPRLPPGYDPGRLLLGDVDGDGCADVVYVGADATLVWFNRSGNGFASPVRVDGTPAPGPAADLRVVDLLGTGTGGVLFSPRGRPPSRPSMYFLDLAGPVKPRLLTRIDNNLGATTDVEYAPSTRFALADAARASTRWRTPLPVVVPVVARTVSRDAISGGRLVTEYRYHHGYWDGVEREFRGFARVDQLDTETFAAYHATPGDAAVDPEMFSPPVLTMTWFHPGGVGPADGDFAELDLGGEYWAGDPVLLDHAGRVNEFLAGLRDGAGRVDRRARRDALRALRGSVLRVETYALDASTRRERPYTVTEHAYGLREVPSAGEPGRPRVFFPYLAASRTTRWERGDDPLTSFSFADDHDAYGHPRRQTSVALPRRSARRRPVTAAVVGQFTPDSTTVLASHTRVEYATPDAGVYIHDRVAHKRVYELADPPGVTESDPADVRAVLADQAAVAEAVRSAFADSRGVVLAGHRVHHYDGPAFTGLPAGQAGRYGATTRTETLVFTGDVLDRAYGAHRPSYLEGSESPPAGAPAGFGTALGYHREPAGWYADTARVCHDFQANAGLGAPVSALPELGLVVAVQDALGHRTDITPDPYRLLPARVRDPLGLEASAEYDYRTGGVSRVVDAHGHATNLRYDAMGRLTATFITGREGEGGTEAQPDAAYAYDLLAFVRDAAPVSSHTTRRVHHAAENFSDEVMELREYSDGFGRLVQRRVGADDLALGTAGDDCGLLVPDAAGVPRPVAGQVGGPAAGTRVGDRVVVSGWRGYDNKGRVVVEYEPFFDRGWDPRPRDSARRGEHTTTYYDALGRPVRTVRPDGAQIRSVHGWLADLTDPDAAAPSAWVSTAYDVNDLASLSSGPDGPLAARASAAHHFTPATDVRDALGRTVGQIVRNGPDPATDWHATRSTYDISGNPLTMVDAMGRIASRHAYDLAGRELRSTSVDAGERWYVPDAAGNTVYSADGRGTAILRTFDVANRESDTLARDRPGDPLTMRERRVYGDGGDPAQPAAQRAAARATNLLGRVSRHYDEAGLITVEGYDFAGNVTVQGRRVIGDAAIAAAEATGGWTADWAAPNATGDLDPTQYLTRTRYDALGRVVRIDTDVADRQSQIVPTYGRSGALVSVAVDGVPYLRRLAHDARGRRLLAVYGNGLMTRYAYDRRTSRLTRVRTEAYSASGDTWTGRGPALEDLTYTHDLTGNVLTITERTTGCGVAGTPDGPDWLVRRFTYDPRYRLTSATGRACANIGPPRPFADVARCGRDEPYAPGTPTHNQASAPNDTEGYTETYAYDPVDNLLDLGYQASSGTWHRRHGLGGLPPAQWPSAPDNRLTSVMAGSQTRELRYDDAGNLIADNGERTFTWDHGGRLVGFRVQAGPQPSTVARYLYAGDGTRVKKWVRHSNAPSTDESTVYIDRQVEHLRWAKAGGGDQVVLHVLDGPRRLATIRTGAAHPDEVGPAVRYHLDDQIGSCTLVADDAGAWLNREEYFPHGETSFGSFARKRYRYMGRERDEESGNTYHGARYHSPSLGRWLSPDPAGVVDGPNLYGFVRGNPIRLTDPGGTNGIDPATVSETVEVFMMGAPVVTTVATTSVATFARWAGATALSRFPIGWTVPAAAPVPAAPPGVLPAVGVGALKLAAELEARRQRQRERRDAPAPRDSGGPRAAPAANPSKETVGDKPGPREKVGDPPAELGRRFEFPAATIEGDVEMELAPPMPPLHTVVRGEFGRISNTISYPYILIIMTNNGVRFKPGQTTQDPLARFRQHYEQTWENMLMAMLVLNPMPRPNAHNVESAQIGAAGYLGVNQRKNTMTEIKGGGPYLGVIERPYVGVIGVIGNRFWYPCDF